MDLLMGACLTFAGGIILWGRDVERRISASESVAEKLGELINILLEDRISRDNDKDRRNSQELIHPRRNR